MRLAQKKNYDTLMLMPLWCRWRTNFPKACETRRGEDPATDFDVCPGFICSARPNGKLDLASWLRCLVGAFLCYLPQTYLPPVLRYRKVWIYLFYLPNGNFDSALIDSSLVTLFSWGFLVLPATGDIDFASLTVFE